MKKEPESSLELTTELVAKIKSPSVLRKRTKSLPGGEQDIKIKVDDVNSRDIDEKLNRRRRTMSKKENINLICMNGKTKLPDTLVNGSDEVACVENGEKIVKLEALSVNNLEGKRRKSVPVELNSDSNTSDNNSTNKSDTESTTSKISSEKPVAKQAKQTSSNDDISTKPISDKKLDSSGSSESELDELEIEDEEKILQGLDLEYKKLTKKCQINLRRSTCSVCEMVDAKIECKTCKKLFHEECIEEVIAVIKEFKCQECLKNMHKCLICNEIGTDQNVAKKCALSKCQHHYHDNCVKNNPLFRKDLVSSINSKVSSYTCPSHTCITCSLLEKAGLIDEKNTKGALVNCIRCPNSYHVGDYCIPAGSNILDSSTIICADHFQPNAKVKVHNKCNVSWCFACCKQGELINCMTCPSAYHKECIRTRNYPDIDDDKDKAVDLVETIDETKWRCEECLLGKRPLNGDIVWAKVGHYRWWPAQICVPRCLPDSLKIKLGQVGEFPVKFFGTNDFYWMNQTRCFMFADGDEFQRNVKSGKSLGIAYTDGVIDAIVAFRELKRLKNEKNNLKKTNVQKRQEYFPIKQCKPFGNVKILKVPLDELPHCDCDKTEAKPCGPSSNCVNVALKYECHPRLCAGGLRCENQRFVRRQYPKQEIIKTSDGRGCGLWALEDIKEGQFVNEYVGELIDDAECKRRIQWANDNDINDFYLMTIHKDRVIDAGPKGNLARFMNHSCEPNCETQRWLVNGDIRIGLFALKNIPAKTELTFNYNLDCLSNEKAVCKCGSKNCSGFLGARPNKPVVDLANAKKRKQNNRNSIDTETILPNPKKIKSQKVRANTVQVPLEVNQDMSVKLKSEKRKSKC